ncbi:MAG: hypothetical protein ACLFPQ_01740 [Candidatus Woesearchaeota archaeon]
MAKVIISKSLREEIQRNFKQKSIEIFELMKTLEKNPQKGKAIGNVGGTVIKELKYNKFRFYFITDGHILKFGSSDELSELLIKFIRMSEKKDQTRVIENIKDILKSIGFDQM